MVRSRDLNLLRQFQAQQGLGGGSLRVQPEDVLNLDRMKLVRAFGERRNVIISARWLANVAEGV